MPRLIDPGEGSAITLDELADALAADPFDCRDEDAFAARGTLLARLARNADFLADAAIAALKAAPDAAPGRRSYGAQVLMLRPPDGRHVIRANLWPARRDPVVQASGTAPFFYDLPHDHNFPFLTVGYQGPGYWSDYYDYDVAALAGLPGEAAGLRFVERARLEPGRVMLYRMRRDVHVQLPPDRFSVSLNILGYDAAQPWLDQYRFDIGRDMIAEALTSTPAEALVTLATHLCNGDGLDLAAGLAATHPCERMRVTALAALLSAAPDAAGPLIDRAAASPSAYLAGHARRLRDCAEADAKRRAGSPASD